MNDEPLRAADIAALIASLRHAHGYDFSGYASAALARRLQAWLARSPFDSFADAQAALLRERPLFQQLLQELTVNSTEVFRDPQFFRALREDVVPHLRTYPRCAI